MKRMCGNSSVWPSTTWEPPHPFRRLGYRPGGRSPLGRWGTGFFLILAVFLFFPSGPLQAATFNVNSTTDVVDSNPGNGVCATAGGVCTMRAAIQEANSLGGGPHTITVPAGTYTLTITGTGEDAAATGDLDITANMTINGAGAGRTIIQAGTTTGDGIDRVFDVIGAVNKTFT